MNKDDIENIVKPVINRHECYLWGIEILRGRKRPTLRVYIESDAGAGIDDCELVSKKNDISFKWNLKFPINSLSIMRGYISVKDNQKDEYLDKFFNAYWRDNVDLSSEKEFSKLLKILEIDNEFFFDKIKQQSTKNELKELTNNAFDKEVFGAPTFIVNNKIFWGQDRLEYALEELSDS